MKIKNLILLLALAAALSATAMTPQEAVNKFLSDNSLRYASVGVSVIDLDSARCVACHLPDQADITASTMKTVVSSAALGILGPHFRFETPVYLDGEVKNGLFKGDIIILGAGDPTLGSVYLPRQANIVQEIVEALRARGITRVEGRIIGDDSLYPFPYFNYYWDVSDLSYDYGTAVHGLNFHDNLVTVSFAVDDQQEVASAAFTPAVPGLQVTNRLLKGRQRDAVNAYLDYSVPALVLTGEAMAKTYTDTYANPDPAAMLVDSVERALSHCGGVRFKRNDGARGKLNCAERSLLVLHRSPQLTEVITSLLDRSDNMFAHALLRAIGTREWEQRGQGAMPQQLDAIGVAAVKRWLGNQGIGTDALFMRDGSGLARSDKASANFFGDMLTMMARRHFDGMRLCDLMPTASGRAGTTLKASPLSSRIVLKSGSMTHVQCFVGYYPADEPRYAFAVLANNFTCSQAAIREQIGVLLTDLFEGR